MEGLWYGRVIPPVIDDASIWYGVLYIGEATPPNFTPNFKPILMIF